MEATGEFLRNEEMILRLADQGSVTTKRVMAELPCSRATANRLLTRLESQGELEEHGRGRSTRYTRRRR